MQCNINSKEEDINEYKLCYYSYDQDRLIDLPYNGNDGNSIFFNADTIDCNGVVFQSLKEISPRYYYQHIDNWISDNNANIDLFTRCLSLAYEHRLYFKTFKPLAHLLEGRGFYLTRKKRPRQANYFIDDFIKDIKIKIRNNELSNSMYRVLRQFIAEGDMSNDKVNKAERLLRRH